jgi:hypothetical protein
MGKLKELVQEHETWEALNRTFLDIAYETLREEIDKDRTDWNMVRDVIKESEAKEKR